MTKEDKLEKIKKLADDMYYAAANLGPNVGSGERLRKTMEDYHKFIIHECKEEPVSEDMWEASKQYALRQVLASTDTKMSEQAYLDLRLFSGFELAVAHKDGANWQKEKDAKLIFNAKDDGYRLGLATMKQQLMANAVDAVVKIDAGGYPYVDRTIELYDYDKDIPLAKEGDKYKVILIKED